MTVKVLILYYSKHGSVTKLAEKIAIGVQQAGAEAIVRSVQPLDPAEQPEHPVISEQELIDCDALIVGSPVRFGVMAAPLKAFWDQTSQAWIRGSLIDKPAGVFTSSGSMHGGNESTLLGMMLPLLHHGMVLCGLPYSEPALNQTNQGGTPYGPSHVSGMTGDKAFSRDEQALCLAFGQRIARITQQLQTGASS
ncbi:NAD(P)H:quinone oxidoreductase [Alkalimonas sp.]|uniref:NAD(P)H:quinone oxidoreductase n=1 Tax=Alkalimonas sp. TaxID=1872453 RepID=UPI00263B1F6E|nr:NAD(P)H:quinone oxidoreductase [Alkalimonas sp.]MCC5826999.1 NAD(P)H:quinone oxidoreductase [Alkalimonas sp.]